MWGRHGEKCSSTYIGERGKTLKARAAAYTCRSSSTTEVSKHLHLQKRPLHQVFMDNIKILDRDPVDYSKAIQEAVHILIHCQTTTVMGENTTYPMSGTSCWMICLNHQTWYSNFYD